MYYGEVLSVKINVFNLVHLPHKNKKLFNEGI
jgi:hypothetical protein